MAETADKKPTLKLPFIMLAAVAIFGGCVYGYHIYRLACAEEALAPQPAVAQLVNSLRAYQAQTGHFPKNFPEINERIWRRDPPPAFGQEGSDLLFHHYWYFYTQVNRETCALWALPMGPKRELGRAFYVALTPNWIRVWKGAALSDEQLKLIRRIPTPEILGQLEMKEQRVSRFERTDSKHPISHCFLR